MNADDAGLVERARAGDAAALEALLAAHQGRIYRFGLKMCGDAQDAQDVLQETMLTLARDPAQVREAGALSSWLYAVARSHCARKRRRSRFAPAEHEALDAEAARLEAPGPDPEHAAARQQIEAALSRAIAGLDPAGREVLLLRDVEGLSAAEVAEALGLGVPAVKSRLHRARLAVRAELAPLLDAGPTPPAAPGTCPDVLRALSRHLEGELRAADCAAMEAHVAACPRCRGACDGLRQVLALCRLEGAAAVVPPPVAASVREALRRALEQKS